MGDTVALFVCKMRVTAQKWNVAGRFGPYCELFFFLKRHELADEPDGVAPTRDWRLNVRLRHCREVGHFPVAI